MTWLMYLFTSYSAQTNEDMQIDVRWLWVYILVQYFFLCVLSLSPVAFIASLLLCRSYKFWLILLFYVLNIYIYVYILDIYFVSSTSLGRKQRQRLTTAAWSRNRKPASKTLKRVCFWAKTKKESELPRAPAIWWLCGCACRCSQAHGWRAIICGHWRLIAALLLILAHMFQFLGQASTKKEDHYLAHAPEGASLVLWA